ncbi:MAG TPA: histidinol-phosphate transaminase [Acidimicrobiales bacterium]|nr:histidinol-phosphate transaminase [Acidimicrobiales bacterium]
MTDGSGSGRTAVIAAMDRYQPRRPSVRVDLSDNTSLWGPPPSVRATLAGLTDAQVSRYPTPYADALCESLAEYHRVDPSRVVTGCGSDDVLDSAIRACCDAGSTIAIGVPTFSVVPAFAEVNEVALASVELERDGSLDAEKLLATGADLFYLCSPNNPTGTRIDDGALRALLRGTDAIVLLDEAYADFADDDATGLLDEFTNLVVVRTMSKAFGLAGLRVGYALGDPNVVGAISVSRGPYKVGSVAEAVALGVLRDDVAWVRERVGEVRALRQWLTSRLVDAGFEVLDSQANFVAVLVEDATRLLDRLLPAGVLARAYTALPVFGDVFRITIGPRPQLDEALGLLTEEAS